ncbi:MULTISPECIES: hypothetical protein [Sphingomonas]|jgi:uncharacterized membrane protein YoaK (UPF0700 family)|uniref:Tryptophan-rich sensory protein n=1 Tax=Sphingomonas hankookensis TaxID=563996 RepID=A0ABR5YAX7_9SPHN|nr:MULTISPECIES: hypothetical protein [Sphingomonas]KZE11450.1 hypothetical protein AVT10_04140 [Sphingomonas hankookensis]PZT92504.1 MAG: hypothetical protein DI625_12725 [Sphingomonas sp.]RSV22219.1 hypothetical protein CA237_15580 [Sphingomonas sp. ABOLH]WCP72139.1 hypothetical protein PPZ50_00780 [Sphingomonas hankookensis]
MPTRALRTSDASPLARALPIICAVSQLLTPLLPGIGIGRSIGEQSNMVRTLVTPAGWAFAIWGALYTGTIVFAVYQALPKQRGNPLLARLRMPAAGAFLGNALWAAYTQLFGLSFPSAIIILFTLLCLIATLRTFSGWPHGFSAGERWCAALPLTALTSWLTVASIVNIAATLRFHGVDAGAAAPLVSALLLVVAGAIAAAALIATRGCPPYALVFLWALAAIWAAGGQAATLVALAVLAAALLVVVGTLTGLSRGGVRHWLGR